MREQLLPVGRGVQAAAVGYVLLAGFLGFQGWSDPGSGVAEVVGLVLLLPATVAALPVMYVVGAVAWTTADDSGRATWQVTGTFTVLFALTAVANLLVVWWLVSAVVRARRRPSMGVLTPPPS